MIVIKLYSIKMCILHFWEAANWFEIWNAEYCAAYIWKTIQRNDRSHTYIWYEHHLSLASPRFDQKLSTNH